MSYQESQRHILQAERCLQDKDTQGARGHFQEAATLYRSFVSSLAVDEFKARSIFGTSTAVLFYKAHDLDAAELVAHELLAQPTLLLDSREELHTLLQAIREERSMDSQHLRLSAMGINDLAE